jgi:hypothetical protein
MQMTKELEKRLKLMQRFNQVLGSKRYTKERIYNNKIFVHNDIMYATDGHIFVVAANLTDQKDFSFFKCSSKKFEYLDSSVQEVKEDKEALRDGEAFEKILQQFNYTSVSFDIDFEGYPLPTKLCSSWSTRWEDKLTVNFQTEEAVIDFCGGLEELGGVTGTYGDIIKNVSGTIPENPMKFAFWNIMEIMKQCKVNKVHIESYPDRHHNTCKVGDYTFLFTDCEY